MTTIYVGPMANTIAAYTASITAQTGHPVTNFGIQRPCVEYDSNGKPIIPAAKWRPKERKPRRERLPQTFGPLASMVRSTPPTTILTPPPEAPKERISHCKISEADIENKSPQEIAGLILDTYESEIAELTTETNKEYASSVATLWQIFTENPIDGFDSKKIKTFLSKLKIPSKLAKAIIANLERGVQKSTPTLSGKSPSPQKSPREMLIDIVSKVIRRNINEAEARKIENFIEGDVSGERVSFILEICKQKMDLESMDLNVEFQSYKKYQNYKAHQDLANDLCKLFENDGFNSFLKRVEIIKFIQKATSGMQNPYAVDFIQNLIELKKHQAHGVDELLKKAIKAEVLSGIYFESIAALSLLHRRYCDIFLSDETVTNKHGDIDIIASKNGSRYFIEVKSSLNSISLHDGLLEQYNQLVNLANEHNATPVILIESSVIDRLNLLPNSLHTALTCHSDLLIIDDLGRDRTTELKSKILSMELVA